MYVVFENIYPTSTHSILTGIPTHSNTGEMRRNVRIQGLGRHKLFCTGLKLCPVCKTMIKILDFETHLERCKNANASPSLTGSPIQTHRILKNIAAKAKPRTSQVRVNHSHTSAVSENASSSPSPLEILEISKQCLKRNPRESFVSTRNGSDRRLTVYLPGSSSKVNLYTSWHHLSVRSGRNKSSVQTGEVPSAEESSESTTRRARCGKFDTRTIVMYIFSRRRI